MNEIIVGDCLEKLKEMGENSIDLLLTDPPYGYSFMGKDWDKAVPKVEIWQECLRVLKSGAFAFIMSSPRQDVLSRMIINLNKAGFRTDFTSIYWTYATGFPKASNIGKMVDKRNSKTSEEYKELGIRKEDSLYNDSGSFSRYFDLDKWASKTFPFLIVPKSSKSEKNKGLEGFEDKKPSGKQDNKYMGVDSAGIRNSCTKNTHPTVKPIKLMSYLITLGSRKGEIVLDPFVGSGTTCISAKMLGRKYIGIEKEGEYAKIAEARLKSVPEGLGRWT